MVIIYLLLLFIQFGFGFLYVGANGGFIKNLYFSFCLFLYFLYLFVGSLAVWNLKDFEFLGYSIEGFYPEGLKVYNIAIAFFLIGYFFKPLNLKPIPKFKIEKIFNDYLLFWLTIFFLVINFFIRFKGYSIEGSFNTYLFLTQDFLITLNIAIYLRGQNKVLYYITLGLSIFLFSANFFRYRILLTLIGIGTIYLIRNPKIIKNLGTYSLFAFSGIYLIFFFTINRKTFGDGNFSKANYNILSSNADLQNLVLSEGNNVQADFNVLQYYRDNPKYPHDYGKTMFIFPFIRALPSFFFKDGVKPFPPSLQAIVDAYGGDYTAKHSGKAVTNIVELFIAFGLPGIIILMFAFGLILKALQNQWVNDNSYNALFQIAILISLFQYITRGYFPQYITHIAYLIMPVYILRFYSKRIKKRVYNSIKLIEISESHLSS